MEGSGTILITGGAGFIGSNLAERMLCQPGTRVRIFDNLSRAGVANNIQWLGSLAEPSRLEIVEGDVRDPAAVRRAARDASEIYHLAAQVAVTTSVEDPGTDFQVNALGTFNVLEAARRSGRNPFLLFTSTNKVYGSLEDLSVSTDGLRYKATRQSFHGVSENEPLDFHSPYGCSKGAADQYVRDYARIYALDSVVFRMSCIAGPRQFGNEDQGWVAHFLYSVLQDRTITVCGDGFQVRDVLHVDDLIDAIMAVRAARHRTRGQVYNLGGGIARSISVAELLQECEKRARLPLRLRYTAVRPGDQPLYISDTTKLELHTGWKARRSINNILDDIESFWHSNRERIAQGGSYISSDNEVSLLTEEVA
ncbi:MAG TPA: GDP-mannose 4,6-dehydratase [Acidisarcina sp.]